MARRNAAGACATRSFHSNFLARAALLHDQHTAPRHRFDEHGQLARSPRSLPRRASGEYVLSLPESAKAKRHTAEKPSDRSSRRSAPARNRRNRKSAPSLSRGKPGSAERSARALLQASPTGLRHWSRISLEILRSRYGGNFSQAALRGRDRGACTFSMSG